MRFYFAFAAALAIASCSDATAPKSDLLRISVQPEAVELMNDSPQPVYVFVVERNSLALVDWAPCSDPSNCDGIAVGGTKVIPYDDITGYAPGAAEAVVHHWHLVPDGAGGFRPDSIRSTVIGLHVHHH
jgi:hypothetical protein